MSSEEEDRPVVRGNGLKWNGEEYVLKSVMLERVKAKTEQVDEASRRLEEALSEAKEAKKAAESFEVLQKEYSEYRSNIEQTEAFRSVGLDGEDNAALRDRLVGLYRADLAMMGDDAERPSVSAWLEAQRDDPLVGRFLPSAPGGDDSTPPDAGKPPSESSSPPAPSAPPKAPSRPPSTTTRLNKDQIRAKHRQMLAIAQRESSPERRAELMSEARAFLRGGGVVSET